MEFKNNIELGNPQITNYTDNSTYDNDISNAFNYVESLYNTRRAKKRINIANRYATKHGASNEYLGFTPTETLDIVGGQGSAFNYKFKNIHIGIDDTRANPYDITSHETAHSRNLFNTKDKSISSLDRLAAQMTNTSLKEDSPYYGNDYSYISDKYKKWLQVDDKHYDRLHDKELSESYSDLMGLRSTMHNLGIVDGTKSRYRNKHIKEMLNLNYNNRYLNNHSNLRYVRKALNKVYKNGGSIDKFWPGGVIKKGFQWIGSKLKYADDVTTAATSQNRTKNMLVNSHILGADGKLFHATIPQQSENFYRVVGWDAIADAKKSQLIRGNPYKPQHGPYFQYNANPQAGVKRLPINSPYITGRYVIEGFPNSATNWVDSWRAVSRRPHIINQYESSKLGFFDESGTAFWKELYETPIKDIRLPIIENPVAFPYLENTGKRLLEFGSEAFPMTNGVFEAPAKNFFYYKHYPLFGWRRFKFKLGGTIK